MTAPGRRLPIVPSSDTTTDAAPGPGSESRPCVLPTDSTGDGMTRRAALQGLAAGLGLAVGAPVDAHDLHHPLAAHVAQRPAKPTPTKAASTPLFFDAHQFATLTLVAELIVPGSVASGSPAYIDEVMAVEHEDVRRSLVSALASVDAAARDAHGTTFRALPAALQPAILETLPRLPTLKSWIAGAHYSSEPGMKELGFTGNVFFQSFPACTHAEGHE